MASIDERSQQYIQEYVQEILNHFQDDLISVVLYGSGATPQFDPSNSDVNLLVILDQFEPAKFKALSKAVRKYKLSGLEPLYVTRSELQGFGDAFPLESADIKENYVTIYGDDVAREIRVSDTAVMEQLCRELLAKSMRLRYLYDEHHNDRKQLGIIINEIVSGYKTLMRMLLKAFDKSLPAPYEYLEIIAQLEERHRLSLEGLREAHLSKRGVNQLSGSQIDATFERILREAENLYQYATTLAVRS